MLRTLNLIQRSEYVLMRNKSTRMQAEITLSGAADLLVLDFLFNFLIFIIPFSQSLPYVFALTPRINNIFS